MLEKYPDMLKGSQVCEILDVSRSTLYRLAREGEFGYYQLRGKRLYPKADIIQYLNRIYQGRVKDIEMVE